MARLSRQLICDLFLSRLDSLLDQNEGIIDVLDPYFVGFLSYPFLLPRDSCGWNIVRWSREQII